MSWSVLAARALGHGDCRARRGQQDATLEELLYEIEPRRKPTTISSAIRTTTAISSQSIRLLGAELEQRASASRMVCSLASSATWRSPTSSARRSLVSNTQRRSQQAVVESEEVHASGRVAEIARSPAALVEYRCARSPVGRSTSPSGSITASKRPSITSAAAAAVSRLIRYTIASSA